MAALRVLIVDDEPDVRVALQSALSGWLPAEVETAASGRLARERFEAGQVFDVVLTDYLMPDGQGDELLAWLRQHRPEVARVLMSGSARGGSGARRGRAHAFPVKPLEPRAVLRVLRAVLPATG